MRSLERALGLNPEARRSMSLGAIESQDELSVFLEEAGLMAKNVRLRRWPRNRLPRGRKRHQNDESKHPKSPAGSTYPGTSGSRDKVERVVTFIEKFCRHSQGEQAGKPFTLLDWQRDEVIAPLYGWYNPDGTKRFRSSAIWISKKNGKSTLISALCAYELMAAGEKGAQVYSAANDRYQAGIVARSMISMLKSNPALLKHVEIVESRNSVLHRASNSRYTVLSADAHRAEGIDASFRRGR